MLTRLRPSRPVRAALLIFAVLTSLFVTTALAATSTVKVKDDFYSVRTVTVSRGSTVTWKWAGALDHTVSVKSGPVRFSSPLQQHGTYRHRFTTRGTYHLYCKIHPKMLMTVVVR